MAQDAGVRALRFLLSASMATGLLFGAVTLAALEGGPVAVLRTTAGDGSERRTHVWFAREDGALWIESATADRPFYLDLVRRPDCLVDTREGPFSPVTTTRVRTELLPEPGGHDRIRELLASRYGWADRWVALLTDTSGSRAVKAVPLPE